MDPNGQEMDLELRNLHIDVHIEDGFARTTIDQTYFNHTTWRLEGKFYFPLPANASLSRLAMYVNGRLMEGGMVERDYARNVFETIKHRSLDPALLEWIDGTTFKMRVFPLEGRQEKRIILSYTQKLDTSYGRTQYRFPAGHNLKQVRDWSAKIHVEHGAGAMWTCESHELNESNFAGDLLLETSAKNVRPNRDIVLNVHDHNESASSKSLLPSGEKVRMRGEGGKDGYQEPPSPQPSPASGRGGRKRHPLKAKRQLPAHGSRPPVTSVTVI